MLIVGQRFEESGATRVNYMTRTSVEFQRIRSTNLPPDFVAALCDLPSLPRVFLQLRQALASPSTTIEQISTIVEQDVGVSAKILQLVNSAFFGLTREVSDVKTAVSCLGMGVLHDLFLTMEVFRSCAPNEYVSEQYLEEFHHHSQLTARIAAGIAAKITDEPGGRVGCFAA
jgi:HD-like signal output (HDOD) protein